MIFTIKHIRRSALTLLPIVCLIACKPKMFPSAFTDPVYTTGVQHIPGQLQCEYYNTGGEGMAFHDTDAVNKGSGMLNKGTDYVSRFRVNEGVDISYTKLHNDVDNSPYNLVQPKADQLYVGWTEPGEWTTYTVKVKAT